MVSGMKTFHSLFLIVFSLLLSLLFFGVMVFQIIHDEFDFSLLVFCFPIGIAFPFLAFTNRVKCGDDYLIYLTWRKKIKIDFEAITEISTNTPYIMKFGGYSLKTYGGREFFLYFPLEHGKMKRVFSMIEKANPGVEFDVWWYKKSRMEVFKVVGKWMLFIFLIVAVINWGDSMGLNLSRIFLRNR